MAINGITSGNYPANYYAQQIQKNNTLGSFTQQLENAAGPQPDQNGHPANEDKQESTSNTEIVTKPDGSRVLLITTQVGGMETVMSIALSQPAPIMGDLNSEKDIKENVKDMNEKTEIAGNSLTE